MKIVIFGAYAPSLINFRGHLIKAILDAGHEVVAVAPGSDPDVATSLNSMGATFYSVPLNRTGLGVVSDLRSVWALRRLFRNLRPDLLLAYTAKPVIWGTIAAQMAGVPLRFSLITGLGSVLQGRGFNGRALTKLITTSLYRFALRRAKGVFFQNPDDREFFESRGIIPTTCKVTVINGSGVDLEHFTPVPMLKGPARFLMVARLTRDKGVLEFLQAARNVKAKHPEARFQLLGPLDTNPTAITQEELIKWTSDGAVEYLGETTDVRPFLAQTHILVLPSYGEGTPRSVLEAMASGRAVITTLVPGCKETVRPGQTGFLVPVSDGAALASAMEKFFEDPLLAESMGAAGRRYAEEKYDVHSVNRVILLALGLTERNA